MTNRAARYQSFRPMNKLRPALRIESLENRLAPAIIAWDGGPTGTGTEWTVAENWVGDKLPGTTDEAQIGAAFGAKTITHSSGTSLVQKLTSEAAITVSGGTLELGNATSTFNKGVTVASSGKLSLDNAKVDGAVAVLGTLIARQGSAINGVMTTATSSLIQVQSQNSFNNVLTVANGFTNLGTIELSSVVNPVDATLKVTNGTLVNESTGTIKSLSGAGGTRNLNVELNNKGNVVIDVLTSLDRVSSDHLNSGTITVSGFFLVQQSGTTPSFSTSGTVTMNNGATFSVRQGEFTFTSGTVGGPGTLELINITANVTPNLSNATTMLQFDQVTYNGPGTLTNANTLTLTRSTINTTLINQGTLICIANNTLNGPLVTNAGTDIQVRGGVPFFSNSFLTVDNGLTNLGTIELTVVSGPGDATLRVVNGTLVNEVSGTINVLAGSGGSRNLDFELNNKGKLTVDLFTTMSHASADHLNSGTITANSFFLVQQSETNPSFSTSGTVTINAGATLSVRQGEFNLTSGNVSGPGTFQLINITANMTPNLSNIETAFDFDQVSYNGPGTLTNVKSMNLVRSTISTVFTNQGTLVIGGTTTLNGPLTTTGGSVIKVRANEFGGLFDSSLVVANGFTNFGAIELSDKVGGNEATIAVTNGILLNDSTASIKATGGATAGTRRIDAVLNNQGTITADQSLVISRISADHVNSGTITANANITIQQSGTTPSFSSTGTMTIAAGQNVNVNNGLFQLDAGTIGGPGTVNFSTVVANFIPDFNNSVTSLTLLNTTINGPGTVTNAKTLETRGSTFNAGLINQGTLITRALNTINGSLVTTYNSVIQIRANENSIFDSALTVTNGFANSGTIELTTVQGSNDATLTIPNGVLFNDAMGLIKTEALNGSGGTRHILGKLNNQGTVQVDAFTMISGELVNFSGTTLTGGQFNLNGLLRFTNADLVTNAASITLNGPAAKIQNTLGVDALLNFAANAAAGNLSLKGGANLTVANDFNNLGAITIEAGTSFSTGTKSLVQASGTTRVDGNLTAASANLNGGDLTGVGQVKASVANSGGSVAPGSPLGALTITGNYTQSGTGALTNELNGTTPITQHDQLVVQGSTVLAGTLAPNLGFVAKVGDSFEIIDNQNGGALGGSFANAPNGIIFSNGLRFQANFAGDDGNDLVLTRLATNVAVTIDDGTAQRSRIRSITLTFGGIVTLPSDPSVAISLNRTGPGGNTGIVPLVVDTSASTTSQTIAKLTFAAPFTTFGSLIDGNYVLNVFADLLADLGGQRPDGDGNGAPGGDVNVQFHRFFGDNDGDRNLLGEDFAAFRKTFSFATGAPEFNAAFDADGNGMIDANDFLEFRKGFGTSLA